MAKSKLNYMKRKYFIILLLGILLFSTEYIFAQKNEIRLSVGSTSVSDPALHTEGSVFYGIPVYSVNNKEMGYWDLSSYHDMFRSDITYSPTFYTGLISVSYIRELYPRLKLSVDFNFYSEEGVRYGDASTAANEYEKYSFSILPTLTYVWLKKNWISLYSGASLGYNKSVYSESENLGSGLIEKFGSYTFMAANLNLIGITLGRDVYVFSDINIGYKGLFQFGLGFKF